MVDIKNPPGCIELGKTGENDFRTVSFDVSEWLALYPNAQVSVTFARPDGIVYPVVLNAASSPVAWKVSAQDVDRAGEGSVEVYMTRDGVVGKSVTMRTMTFAGLERTVDAPPADDTTWLDSMLRAAARAERACAAAEAAADSAQQNTALAAVATTGSYNDLANKPVIPQLAANLTETVAGKALDATQGKLLADSIAQSSVGADGVTFTPAVSAAGDLSWSNDGGKVNPATVNIKGPAGADGAAGANGTNGLDGAAGADGVTFTPAVSAAGDLSWSNDGGKANPATVNIKGPAGADGLNGADGAAGANGTNGLDGAAGADGVTFTPVVSAAGDLSWSNDGGKANPATVNIKGPAGADGGGGGLAADTAYYIAASGSDATGTGSESAPWATLSHALTQIPRNLGGYTATLHIADGSYGACIVNGFACGVLELCGASTAAVLTRLSITNCACSVKVDTLSLTWLVIHAVQYCWVHGCTINAGTPVGNIAIAVSGALCNVEGTTINSSFIAVNADLGAHVVVQSMTGTGNTRGYAANTVGGFIQIGPDCTMEASALYMTGNGGRVYKDAQTNAGISVAASSTAISQLLTQKYF